MKPACTSWPSDCTLAFDCWPDALVEPVGYGLTPALYDDCESNADLEVGPGRRCSCQMN